MGLRIPLLAGEKSTKKKIYIISEGLKLQFFVVVGFSSSYCFSCVLFGRILAKCIACNCLFDGPNNFDWIQLRRQSLSANPFIFFVGRWLFAGFFFSVLLVLVICNNSRASRTHYRLGSYVKYAVVMVCWFVRMSWTKQIPPFPFLSAKACVPFGVNRTRP